MAGKKFHQAGIQLPELPAKPPAGLSAKEKACWKELRRLILATGLPAGLPDLSLIEQVAKQQARAERLRAELGERETITEESFMHAGWGHLLTLEREIRTGLQALMLSPRSRASARIPESMKQQPMPPFPWDDPGIKLLG